MAYVDSTQSTDNPGGVINVPSGVGGDVLVACAFNVSTPPSGLDVIFGAFWPSPPPVRRDARSKVPNSLALPGGKKAAGFQVPVTASATFPAIGPSFRVRVDTPMFGVEMPPALSALNVTPRVWSAIDARVSTGPVVESRATRANAPDAPSKPAAT